MMFLTAGELAAVRVAMVASLVFVLVLVRAGMAAWAKARAGRSHDTQTDKTGTPRLPKAA